MSNYCSEVFARLSPVSCKTFAGCVFCVSVAFAMDGILEVVFLFGFLYWVHPGFFTEGVSRVNKMVDVVTNRMFDTFSRFDPRQNDSLSTITSLKRFAADQRYKKILNREAENKIREGHLFDIKENAPSVNVPKRRPLMGLSCSSCTPTSRDSLVKKTTEHLSLKNILDFRPTVRTNSLLRRSFFQLMQIYEFKRFNYPQVAGKVIKDPRIKHAVEKAAVAEFQDSSETDDDYYQKLLKLHEARAKKLLKDMRSTLSDFLLKFTTWVLYKLLPCFLSSVVVHPGQVQMLKDAGSGSLPLIFLPLHRSHLDYILISFILLNNNVRAPLVAAGDNLRIPFFGSLLRGLGAFFIKRRIDPIMGRRDHVYKAVLHTYMNECLRAGHNMEFFLEGGRTRTGKPCMPKYGILSIIVDAFMDGTIEDALLVPVSVNYERLVDGNFVREQLGQPKQMETFGAAIKGIWHVLNSNYGMMRIDFNQPFSLRELVKTFNSNGKLNAQLGPNKKILKSNPSTNSLYGTDVVSEEDKSLVENISKHVIYDCAKSTSVMSTNALSFLLLYKFRDGATVAKISEALDELRQELKSAGRDIGFTGNSTDVINYATSLLGANLLTKEVCETGESTIKPIRSLASIIELNYYANTLVTYFALESIVAVALSSLDATKGFVYQEDLLNAALDLCNIFQYEFIFCKPCQTLDSTLMDCIEEMAVRKEIFVVRNEITNENLRSRRIAHEMFDEDSDEESVERTEYEINETEENVRYLRLLRNLLMPLIEVYTLTAYSLQKLVGKEQLENDLIREILDETKRWLEIGTIHFEESVSVDPVKNALKLFQKWDVLDSTPQGKLRLFYLKENQDNNDCATNCYNRLKKYMSDV